MKYKLLALDVDGTIVIEGAQDVPKPVYDAIQKAIKKGVVVALVTARSHSGFRSIAEKMHLPSTYHVLENGAKIIDPKGKVVRNIHIPDPEVQEILNVSASYFNEVGICTDDQWIDQDIDIKDKIVTGLSFACKKKANIPLLLGAINRIKKKYSVYSIKHWSEPSWGAVLLFHKNATKGKGMDFIQKKLGIKPEETIACGDASTDVSMF